MTDMRFAGRTALITGAASGIGRATALRLAAEGATLALGDIDEPGLLAVAEQIRSDCDATIHAVAFDAAQPTSCRDLVDVSMEKLGKLDALLNIAGVFDWDHFTDTTDEHWSRIIAVDLNALFHLSRRAMPHLLRTKGNIVNAASSAGVKGQAYCAAYCAAKHGVVGLTKALAIEYAEAGVRVNAVCPGGIKTGLTTKIRWHEDFNPRHLALLNAKLDGGAMAEPEEVATLFAYLASDDAKYITGATILIDGGQLAG